MSSPIYILGTGLSHNGSAVLLKDGKVCVGIEKERLSRIKHDGGNDTMAIQYCLDAEGISLSDVSLVVQCANFEIPDRSYFKGKRIFADTSIPLINISHHLAHAYSAVGTSPFTECAVMVIDGCGSPLHQFLELHPEQKEYIAKDQLDEINMVCEKDSFYHFDGQTLIPLFKDFSKMAESGNNSSFQLPTTQHSIGGFYAAVSRYVFGDMDDVGKLMGLAPFGESGVFNFEAFNFIDGKLYVNEDWKDKFTDPSQGYDYFKANFTYYANVALWAQQQVEKAVLQCISNRLQKFPHENLCYTGGVALNAVANAKLEDSTIVKNIYFEPAAADNGLALGCAYYGWLEYLKMPKVEHDGSTCFGKKYTSIDIETALQKEENKKFSLKVFKNQDELVEYCAAKLVEGKTVGWFQSGSEFGPRSLGRRSILAHPGIDDMKDHINLNIKFREDFRPFAPAVLKEKVSDYFITGRNSPYMILVDKTRPEYTDMLKNVTHKNGSARVQTVEESWNPLLAKLLYEFYKQTGLAVLLNTSLNKKGMPIVETPEEAIALFEITALDILVLENYVLEK